MATVTDYFNTITYNSDTSGDGPIDNYTNAQGAINGSFATSQSTATGSSHIYECSNWGGSVPAGSTLTGANFLMYYDSEDGNEPTASSQSFLYAEKATSPINSGYVAGWSGAQGDSWRGTTSPGNFRTLAELDISEQELWDIINDVSGNSVYWRLAMNATDIYRIDSIRMDVEYTPPASGALLGGFI
jgi:hypothetical protein